MKRLLVVLSISLFLCACGGGGSTGTTNASTALPITVSVSPSAQTALDQGQTLAFNATVSNDVQSQGVKWSVSGAACSGSACGTLTNTTNTTATYNTPASVTSSLTVKVTATSIADTTKSAASTAVINPAPAVTTTTLASGIAGTVYNATLAATGGTGNLTWGLVSGSAVPAGLNLSNSGALSGTPTAAGTSTFTVTVTDSAATPVAVQKQLAITVNAPLAVTTASLSSGVVDSTYSASLASSGGAASVSWSLAPGSSLPANLTLSGSGTISGIPTAAGTTNFTVVATDSGKPTPQTAKQQLSITIEPGAIVDHHRNPRHGHGGSRIFRQPHGQRRHHVLHLEPGARLFLAGGPDLEHFRSNCRSPLCRRNHPFHRNRCGFGFPTAESK